MSSKRVLLQWQKCLWNKRLISSMLLRNPHHTGRNVHWYINWWYRSSSFFKCLNFFFYAFNWKQQWNNKIKTQNHFSHDSLTRPVLVLLSVTVNNQILHFWADLIYFQAVAFLMLPELISVSCGPWRSRPKFCLIEASIHNFICQDKGIFRYQHTSTAHVDMLQ